MVEEKRGRAIYEEDVIEPENKRRSLKNKEAFKEQKSEKMPSSTHPGGIPLPKEWWEKSKGKEKDDVRKSKSKNPAYKLQSHIEISTNMKSILEEKILDAKIEFTLKEALGVTKKDFYELIINVIKKKRYSVPYWARITMETCVRLGDSKDPILALVDHGSKINIMSRQIYEKNK
uniref:Predicted protein n=1 Tax=Physcomitrium patens TaxID=3218 RepID=A9U5E8_PHYPA